MKKVSFCIPCYKSEQTLPKVVDEIRSSMEELSEKYEYEIILVNDASTDGTFNVICKLVDTYPNITGIDLAKNFGQHAALMAGFAHVTGDILTVTYALRSMMTARPPLMKYRDFSISLMRVMMPYMQDMITRSILCLEISEVLSMKR